MKSYFIFGWKWNQIFLYIDTNMKDKQSDNFKLIYFGHTSA